MRIGVLTGALVLAMALSAGTSIFFLLAAPTASAQVPGYPQTPGPQATKLFAALKNDEPDQVSAILSRTPSLIEARDEHGDTPLIVESFWGSLIIIKILVARHANVNAADDVGSTGLIQAATFDKMDILQYLIAKGAALNTKDDNGNTALFYATQMHNNDVVAVLKAHGAR